MVKSDTSTSYKLEHLQGINLGIFTLFHGSRCAGQGTRERVNGPAHTPAAKKKA
jgi:hypothetical protein